VLDPFRRGWEYVSIFLGLNITKIFLLNWRPGFEIFPEIYILN
jgi:hypothetical protein